MRTNFEVYPALRGLSQSDKNIDHRRVPNLMKFFERHGKVKKNSRQIEDYKPGDIVCWDLGHGIKHIGIVSDKRSADNQRYLIVHNIGAGQVLQNCIFDWSIIGHYSY